VTKRDNNVHRRPPGLPIHGILLLDKSKGISSNGALQQVKRLFNARKAGHTGSLDPLASGMLPICFGEATKFSQFLLDANKHYFVIAKLGEKTNTADAEGEIIETRPVEHFSREQLEHHLTKFRGPIEQIPSMYSAIKHQGQPLYKLARQGIEIERKPRAVMIHALTLLEQTEKTLTLTVHCSKGTYIRNLVEDLGEQLGCGAHVAELRRLAVDPYLESQMINFAELATLLENKGPESIMALLHPINTLVQDYPKISLAEASAFYLNQGQAVMVPNAPTSGLVSLYVKTAHNQSEQFLGIGEVTEEGKITPRRLIARM
jgi:tRNA pseudouridine55 synthase